MKDPAVRSSDLRVPGQPPPMPGGIEEPVVDRRQAPVRPVRSNAVVTTTVNCPVTARVCRSHRVTDKAANAGVKYIGKASKEVTWSESTAAKAASPANACRRRLKSEPSRRMPAKLHRVAGSIPAGSSLRSTLGESEGCRGVAGHCSKPGLSRNRQRVELRLGMPRRTGP